MPRPNLAEQLRKVVREYLTIAETRSAAEAPLNTLAVARQLGHDRKSLKKYGLDAEIAEAAERQASNGKRSPKEIERRSLNDTLRDRASEIESMRRRCEALIARICLAEGNAQQLGIDPTELWKPIPMPDRSLPFTGTNARHSKRT
jgi:hypothetical protein